jgi:uncharacterized protein DUF2846
MAPFRWLVAAVFFLSFLAPITLLADDKKDSEEPSKELQLKACGPKESEVNYKPAVDKKQHPTQEQNSDKAVIYVLRPSMVGMAVQTKLAVDGDWKGENRGNNYFYFTLDPGEHYFCSVAENHSLLQLNVEAGKTYYLQQHIVLGVMKARNKIAVMTEEEGRKKLADAHLSIWTVKDRDQRRVAPN